MKQLKVRRRSFDVKTIKGGVPIYLEQTNERINNISGVEYEADDKVSFSDK